MKRAVAIVVLLVAAFALAQEKSVLTVKDSSVATGVVLVEAQSAGKAVELQCNQGSAECTQLKKGNYVMITLPKNHGMYDCQNVDIYPETADPENTEKLGEYCFTTK
jgi:hypothetical protein